MEVTAWWVNWRSEHEHSIGRIGDRAGTRATLLPWRPARCGGEAESAGAEHPATEARARGRARRELRDVQPSMSRRARSGDCGRR
jgi:hypothetical protein